MPAAEPVVQLMARSRIHRSVICDGLMMCSTTAPAMPGSVSRAGQTPRELRFATHRIPGGAVRPDPVVEPLALLEELRPDAMSGPNTRMG
jgi:hypothetical protein